MVDGVPVPASLSTPAARRAALSGPPAPPSATSPTPTPALDAARLAEVRSEELQEIVGQVPGRLVRWGSTVLFAVVVTLLVLACVVRYPEVVTGAATLTTASPPVRLVTRSGGEVQHVLARDGESVAAGGALVVLRGSADYADVIGLSERLDRFEAGLRSGTPAATEFPSSLVLGPVQREYAVLLQAWSEHRAFRDDAYYADKATSLEQRITEHERLAGPLQSRLRLQEEELVLAGRHYERNAELARQGLLSIAEAEQAAAAQLQRRQAREDSRNALLSNTIRVSEMRSSLLDLRQERKDRELRLQLTLTAAYDGLRESVRAWEEAHLLRAPTTGRVAFIRPLAEGQFIAAGEPVVAVVPEGAPTSVSVLLPQATAGRVRPGQRVVLRLDAYPAGEFGTVEGRVARLSLVPDRAQPDGSKQPLYLVTVDLPDGLVTSRGRTLDPQQEMQATADIVTDDQRVIDRLLYRFRSLGARRSG